MTAPTHTVAQEFGKFTLRTWPSGQLVSTHETVREAREERVRLCWVAAHRRTNGPRARIVGLR
jgi:hypothetical protein